MKTMRARGFTLIEVLIALTLMSILMAILTSAMYSMGQTEDRVEQRVAAADDYRTAMNFLRDTVGRVSARKFRSMVADTPAQVPFFEAQPDSLAWVGVLPARFGAGGRNYMRLSVESGQLVLRFSPWTGATSFTNWDQAAAQPLAAPMRAISLRYLEPASNTWSPVWPPPGVDRRNLPPTLLPAAVELQFDGPQPPWPPLVVALRSTFASSISSLSSASFGGRGAAQ